MNIYRLTIHRGNPEYWQSRKQIKYVTERSLTMTLKANRFNSVEIARAPVGEFVDVTAEFVKGDGE